MAEQTERREAMDDLEFAKVYIPMAKEGKSALDIANALNVGGDDKSAAQYVTIKAHNIRKKLEKEARAVAVKENLDEDATEALVVSTTAKMPKLQTRGRRPAVTNMTAALDALFEADEE